MNSKNLTTQSDDSLLLYFQPTSPSITIQQHASETQAVPGSSLPQETPLREKKASTREIMRLKTGDRSSYNSKTHASSIATTAYLEKMDQQIVEGMKDRLEGRNGFGENRKINFEEMETNFNYTKESENVDEDKKKNIHKFVPLILLLFCFIIATTIILFERAPRDKKEDIDDVYNETEEYDVFICEDEKRLCEFEIEDLCENCRCLHSFVFLEEALFGMNILENVYVLDIKIGSVLAFNATQIRSGFLSETLCNLCEDIENKVCEVDDEVQCCANFEFTQ
eukprot:maker-scaffold_8-snap-gene-11.39-mRNA-1 protein AED:0.11 eAED:0.11 QI:57/0.5/0.33/1/1/1/3/0/280